MVSSVFSSVQLLYLTIKAIVLHCSRRRPGILKSLSRLLHDVAQLSTLLLCLSYDEALHVCYYIESTD